MSVLLGLPHADPVPFSQWTHIREVHSGRQLHGFSKFLRVTQGAQSGDGLKTLSIKVRVRHCIPFQV